MIFLVDIRAKNAIILFAAVETDCHSSGSIAVDRALVDRAETPLDRVPGCASLAQLARAPDS